MPSCWSSAHAAPGTCTNTFVIGGPTFSQNFTIDAGGATVTPVGGSGVFDCIRQQDKLFSAFSFGALPGSGAADLSFGTVGGQDTHSISLTGSGLTNGSTYTVGYNIEVVGSLAHLLSSNSAILQSSGVASLIESRPIVSGNTSTALDPSGCLGGCVRLTDAVCQPLGRTPTASRTPLLKVFPSQPHCSFSGRASLGSAW